MPEKEKNSQNIIIRVGEEFNNEIEDIKKTRLKRKIDKKKKSTRKLTNQIVRHIRWLEIKKDLIELNFEEKDNE